MLSLYFIAKKSLIVLCNDVNRYSTFQLDGYIARKVPGQGILNMISHFVISTITNSGYISASRLGSFLDPLADKILVTTLYFSLTYANLIPASLTAMVISRDVLLIYAGLYIRYMSVQPPVS